MPVRAPMFPRRNSTTPTAHRDQPILLRHRLARRADRTGCAGRALDDRGWVLRPRDLGIIRSPRRWAD